MFGAYLVNGRCIHFYLKLAIITLIVVTIIIQHRTSGQAAVVAPK